MEQTKQEKKLEKIEFSIRMLYLHGYISDEQRASLDKKLIKDRKKLVQR